MPTRTFDDTNVTDIVQGYVFGPTGSISPTLSDHSFSHFSIDGSHTEGPGVGDSSCNFQYQKTGLIGFTDSIVGIPVGALITRVVVRTPRSTTIGMSAVCDGAVGSAAIELTGLDSSHYDSNDLTIPVVDGGVCPISIDPFSYSFSRSGSAADQIFDYSSSPITRSQLISSFGSPIFFVNIHIFPGGSGGSSADFFLSFDAGWSIQVTYLEGSFSWFVPFETVIVNGRPFRVPTGSPVLAAENPNPQTYYDSGDIEPVNTYWFSPDWWFFYPFTTIPPDDDSGWISSVTPPECISCLTLALGNITVLVADASGAYTLQKNKTNDTMYVRTDPESVTTEDAPIPSPNAKIGFVP